MGDLGLRISKLLWALGRKGPRHVLLAQRVLASSEHRRIPFRDSYRTLVDIGAHRGQFSIFAAHAFPRTRIYSFEPQPDARAQLAKVARALPVDVMIFPFALGAEWARSDMHVSARDDSSSLLPITALGQVATFPGTHEVGLLPVEVRTLDEVLGTLDLPPPVLMKIDVQGTELDVLRGGHQTLQRVDDVLIECSFRELYHGQSLVSSVLAQLFAWNFQIADVSSGARDEAGPIQADFLLRRNSPFPDMRSRVCGRN